MLLRVFFAFVVPAFTPGVLAIFRSKVLADLAQTFRVLDPGTIRVDLTEVMRGWPCSGVTAGFGRAALGP
jgi:hypothetical protein